MREPALVRRRVAARTNQATNEHDYLCHVIAGI